MVLKFKVENFFETQDTCNEGFKLSFICSKNTEDLYLPNQKTNENFNLFFFFALNVSLNQLHTANLLQLCVHHT